ncbi:hypothetical protein JTB14_001328 [Gonioctena quinquepunctata]|nr:hypothetical protein JTB14_001328 [Gonioctena quinquepunctata]
MVRKRARTSRKYYESDEPETDSDYGEDPAQEPAPKKYSLRQRKRASFTDFDYDDDGVQVPPKAATDDEEYEVDKEIGVEEAPSEEPSEEYVAPSTYENSVEPEQSELPADTDELVDFEDMIRADIVVNKNRIDYDNVIQKTEIKVQSLEGKDPVVPVSAVQQPKPKAKRGRKPKRRNSDMDEGHFLAPLLQEDENDEDYHPYKPKRERKQKKRAEGEIDSSFLEPETEVQEDEYEDKDDVDYNPDDDDDIYYGDIAHCMQTEYNEAAVKVTDETEGKVADEAAGNVAVEAAEKVADEAAEKVADEAAEKVAEVNKNVTETTVDVAKSTDVAENAPLAIEFDDLSEATEVSAGDSVLPISESIEPLSNDTAIAMDPLLTEDIHKQMM